MIPHDLHHFFVGQHVFVTGESGFISGHVASLLIRAGAHVRALTRSTKGATTVRSIGWSLSGSNRLRCGLLNLQSRALSYLNRTGIEK